MPTEHEYKFVLKKDSIIEDLKTADKAVDSIIQGYLSTGVRVRYRRDHWDSEHWTFTYKQRVNNRVIEIETDISERDGRDLLLTSQCVLRKERNVLYIDKYFWEIDFFFNDATGDIYFVLAEVEVEEGGESPVLPKIIQDNLLHKVDLTDNRFSSRNLADSKWATALYQKLIMEEENERLHVCEGTSSS